MQPTPNAQVAALQTRCTVKFLMFDLMDIYRNATHGRE